MPPTGRSVTVVSGRTASTGWTITCGRCKGRERVATGGDPPYEELVVTRVLDAPREFVFRAWTEPERVRRWWGPEGFTAPYCDLHRLLRGCGGQRGPSCALRCGAWHAAGEAGYGDVRGARGIDESHPQARRSPFGCGPGSCPAWLGQWVGKPRRVPGRNSVKGIADEGGQFEEGSSVHERCVGRRHGGA